MRNGRTLAMIFATLGALGVLVAPAFASSQPASGSFTESPETILSERQANGNTIIHLTRDAAISGTYTGIEHADQWVSIIGTTPVGGGSGRIVGEPGVGGTYEGQVQCD